MKEESIEDILNKIHFKIITRLSDSNTPQEYKGVHDLLQKYLELHLLHAFCLYFQLSFIFYNNFFQDGIEYHGNFKSQSLEDLE